MNTYNRKEGDEVYFELTGVNNIPVSGTGTIRGLAIPGAWIVEVNEPAPYDTRKYPFSCVLVMENQIKPKQ